jgi:hypothetical protein
MWLNVRFFNAGGTLLAESGAYDPLTGVLSHDDALKVYEAKPGLDEVVAPLVGVEPGPSFHFVLNNKIFKDNRIPPRGFTNATSPVSAVCRWAPRTQTVSTGTRRRMRFRWGPRRRQ